MIMNKSQWGMRDTRLFIMKHIKHFLIPLIGIFVSESVSAYDFEAGGVYYEIMDVSNSTCRVVSGDVAYTGDVVIPSYVTFDNEEFAVVSIGDNAFNGCYDLISVSIGENVLELGTKSFIACSKLTTVNTGSGVRVIKDSAFENCNALETVTIGKNVTEIGSHVFFGCLYLTAINSLNSIPPTITESTFELFHMYGQTTTVFVPTGSLEAYKAAEYWSIFGDYHNIEETDFSNVTAVANEDIMVSVNGCNIMIKGSGNQTIKVYNTNGQLAYSGTDTTIGGLASGIYIVQVGGRTFKAAVR